jgi:long-chain acyl-CoA synthetase
MDAKLRKKVEGTMAARNLAEIFWNRIEESGTLPAQLVKREGRWHTLTWGDVGEIVRDVALGLMALGRGPGDTVAVLSQSRAEWVQADFGILSIGAVTVPIYPTYLPEQIAYIVNDAGARTLIVENANQLAKVLQVWDDMPRLEHVVVIQGHAEDRQTVLTWDELRRLGRGEADRCGHELRERIGAISAGDEATIVYTSGTTGPPKGVVQTHRNHLAALYASAHVTPVEPGDVHLLFLPLAHSFSRLESFNAVYRGLVTAFAEGLDRLADNLRQVRPHFICSVPRVFEKVYAGTMAKVQSGSPLKRRLFSWAVTVGREVSNLKQARKPVPGGLALRHWLAHRLVFSKLHAALGGRLRFAVSGGAPLSGEIAGFFHAVGIPILEGYGLTETCPVLTFNRIDRFKFGSVGQAIPGVELRLAEDGEILARGPNIATRGYLGKPDATAEAFGPDDWFRTGDIGRLDEEGFLFITDRKKDLIVTAGGMNIAPQNIEHLLLHDPLISHVMVYGDRRPYPVALVTLNPDAAVALARAHGIDATAYAELSGHPVVVERVARIIEKTNAHLASYARIKRFAVLSTEFSLDGGELTPTLKLKRRVVAEKYRDLLESLYR